MGHEARERRSDGGESHRPREKTLGPLGPDPLEIKSAAFRKLLQRRRAIKSLLLDQTIIAGLGNIYCDESLFAACIHPLRQARSLTEDEANRLLRAIKTTLRRAIRFKGSTFMDYRDADGKPGSFQRFHRVYDRGGEPCRACGTLIAKIVVAGRSSWYCRMCQPRSKRQNVKTSKPVTRDRPRTTTQLPDK